MVVSIVIFGYPKNGWFLVENPNLKWRKTRATPIYGNTQLRLLSWIRPVGAGVYRITVPGGRLYHSCFNAEEGGRTAAFQVGKALD